MARLVDWLAAAEVASLGLVLVGPIGDEASSKGLPIREQCVSGPRMFVMMVNGSVEDGAGCLSRRCLS